MAIQFPSLLKIRESSHAAFPPILAVVFQSHADWADVLYRSDSKLIGNIFPSFDPDLDGDGKPDGYDLRVSKLGTAPSDAGLPEKHMLTVEKPGMILRMPGLGGLPHGAAESECWICGPAGAQVTVRVDKVGTFPFGAQGRLESPYGAIGGSRGHGNDPHRFQPHRGNRGTGLAVRDQSGRGHSRDCPKQ